MVKNNLESIYRNLTENSYHKDNYIDKIIVNEGFKELDAVSQLIFIGRVRVIIDSKESDIISPPEKKTNCK